MEAKRARYQKTKFLEERLTNLNEHAKRAFLLQQIGSILAFFIISIGILLTYLGKTELAIIQGASSIAVSLVTYLFYKQSNKANDDTNKFALISIKFNESWNIIQEALKHCSYITDENQRNATVQKLIEKQIELALSQRIWELKLDLQKAPVDEENMDATNLSTI